MDEDERNGDKPVTATMGQRAEPDQPLLVPDVGANELDEMLSAEDDFVVEQLAA
jgi:hypothetical protein